MGWTQNNWYHIDSQQYCNLYIYSLLKHEAGFAYSRSV